MFGKTVETVVEEQEKPAVTPLDSARTAATKALEELGNEIARNLHDRLEAVDKPLREEIGTLQAKAAVLRESFAALKPRTEAKVRLLATAIDEAVADGRDDEAAQKRAEAADLEASLKNIQAEADRCDARVIALERQRLKNIALVFEEVYADARRATVEASTEIAALLDRVWSSLCEYDKASTSSLMPGFARIRRKTNLTPDEYGVEKEAFLSLHGWFAFGGRNH